MITATPELTKPRREGITGQIRTLAQEHDQLIVNVANAARSHAPTFTDNQARPVTGETPIPASPALDAVRAVRIGSEELKIETVKRDARHIWEILKNFLIGNESIWARLGKGRQAISIARDRSRAQWK